jgi:hypothetical protein
VKAGTGIVNFESIAGKRIAVVPGTTNIQAIRDQLTRRRLDATLVEFSDREELPRCPYCAQTDSERNTRLRL